MHESVWKRRLPLLAVALLVPLVGIAAASSTSASTGRTAKAARLTVEKTMYGKAVFGPSGKVLYVFGPDRGKSHCYGACARAWPPLLTEGKPVAGPGAEASLIGTTSRKDGKLQVTYNGHPLYYYADDKKGGVMCQHVNMHGGLWLIIKPNGAPNMAMGHGM